VPVPSTLCVFVIAAAVAAEGGICKNDPKKVIINDVQIIAKAVLLFSFGDDVLEFGNATIDEQLLAIKLLIDSRNTSVEEIPKYES
jgi:hypothetical protein